MVTAKEMFGDAIAAAVAKAEEQFAATAAQRPGLVQALAEARRGFDDANARFHSFQTLLTRATRGGINNVPRAVAEMEGAERALRDAAGLRLTIAKRALADCDWNLQCRRDEIEQLTLLSNPPDRDFAPVIEVVKRPAPPDKPDLDLIVFPAAGRAA
jgi:hypothetical protein